MKSRNKPVRKALIKCGMMDKKKTDQRGKVATLKSGKLTDVGMIKLFHYIHLAKKLKSRKMG